MKNIHLSELFHPGFHLGVYDAATSACISSNIDLGASKFGQDHHTVILKVLSRRE